MVAQTLKYVMQSKDCLELENCEANIVSSDRYLTAQTTIQVALVHRVKLKHKYGEGKVISQLEIWNCA